MNRWIKGDVMSRHLLMPAPDECDYEYRMLASVAEGSLITPMIVFEEGQKCLSYDITGLRKFGEVFSECSLRSPGICGLILQINRALELLEKYLLCEQNLVLDEENIFVDQEQQLKFCVHPQVPESFGSRMHDFLGFVLVRTDRDDPGSLKLAAELFSETYSGEFRLCDLTRLMLEARKDSHDIKAAEPDEYEPAATWTAEDLLQQQAIGPATRDTEPENPSRWEKYPADMKEMLLRLGLSQLIMSVGLAAVYLLRGKTAVRHALPIYLILCVTIAGYFLLDLIAGRIRRGREDAAI